MDNILNFETKASLNGKLWELLQKAHNEADPTDKNMNPHWRDTVKEAMQLADTLEYDFVYDLLYEIARLTGTGVSLRSNAQNLIRVVKREVKEKGRELK